MTTIHSDAWWCKYCAHGSTGQCAQDVPWYASSLQCKFYAEPGEVERERPPKKRFNLKRVLVDTF